MAAVLLTGSLFVPAVPARAIEVNRVVVRVNDRIATLHDYRQRRDERVAALTRAELDPGRREELLTRAGEATLRDIFEELLVLSRADQLGLEASVEQVERAVAQTRENFGLQSEEEFQVALARSGMTIDDLREQMRRNLLIREVMGREVQSRIEIDEEELRRYYYEHAQEFELPEQVRLKEVVILESAGLGAEEMARIAGDVRREILAGKAMEEAIRELEARGQTSEVIELGWVRRGDLDPALEAAVWGLEVDAVSEPVAGRGGLHLLQVEERRAPELREFREVLPELEARERERRFQQELREYMQELAEKSYVVAEPPPDAAGFSTAFAGEEDGALEAIEELSPGPMSEPPAEAESEVEEAVSGEGDDQPAEPPPFDDSGTTTEPPPPPEPPAHR